MLPALLLALLAGAYASAACETGKAPAYSDISYVAVRQSSLVGQAWPHYTFEAAHYAVRAHADVSLDARGATKIRGTFVAVNPLAAFSAVIGVLEKHDFFAMRLHPATQLYLDGPEDTVTVERCGVTTVLGTVTRGEEMNLDDAQAKAFFALEGDLRSAIFAQEWQAPPTRR